MEVIRHHENLGLGAALRTAFTDVRSPIVCTIDSDCTYPPERLRELVALARAGIPLVTASPWHPDSVGAEGSRMRLVLSRAVSGLYRRLLGQDVHTFTCLFRAYRTDLVRGIRFRSDGFAAVAEILLRALAMGQRISEVPMQLERRRFGESKLRVDDGAGGDSPPHERHSAEVSAAARPQRSPIAGVEPERRGGAAIVSPVERSPRARAVPASRRKPRSSSRATPSRCAAVSFAPGRAPTTT
jgi:glycosyltransferase involved in cell wall biosynthesis